MLSFNYTYKNDSIFIIPCKTQMLLNSHLSGNSREIFDITRRLNYFRKRHGLTENEMIQFSHQYRNIPQTRELIEKAFKEFIKSNRLKGIISTEFQGKVFLNEIQELIIQIYQNTKMGELLPNGYPIII